MKGKTAAEEQIELLRQMKDSRLKRKPAPLPPPSKPTLLAQGPTAPAQPLAAGASTGGSGFELAEKAAARPKARKGPGQALPVGKETYKLLMQRQREQHEFKRRQDMGEWAASLLLALPPGAHALPAQARADLLKRMREWCVARGLE